MCNVLMIRKEPDLVFIPVERAVYCENCETISNSAWSRCGLCGSEEIVELSSIFTGPPDPGSPPGLGACPKPPDCRLVHGKSIFFVIIEIFKRYLIAILE